MVFLIQQTLAYAVPLMIVALAGVFAERSGIINLALEGIMIFGAFVGVQFVKIMQEKEREKGVWKSKAWEPSCQKNRDMAFWIASGGSY